MSTSAKQVVKDFYNADILKNSDVLKEFFHKDIELIWNSTDGLTILNFNDLNDFFAEVRRTYHDIRAEVSHLLQVKSLYLIC